MPGIAKVTLIAISEDGEGPESGTVVGTRGFSYLPDAKAEDAMAAAEKALRQAGFQWAENMLEVWRSQQSSHAETS